MQTTAMNHQERFTTPETLERGLLLAAVGLAATALFLQLGFSLHAVSKHIIHELSGVLAEL
jgi:hypothetical protein